jgi:hypothetical protein
MKNNIQNNNININIKNNIQNNNIKNNIQIIFRISHLILKRGSLNCWSSDKSEAMISRELEAMITRESSVS